jgi:hypothetical protein
MSRDAWIETVPEEQAAGLLKELYDRERDPRVGVVDNILKVHSLHPETLRAHADLDVNQVAAYYAYANRVADGLGIGVDAYVQLGAKP